MLARVGKKNSRLYDLVIRGERYRAATRPARASVAAELERERARIARELHAGAGQPLAGIKLNLEMLDDCAQSLPPPAREAFHRLQTLAEQALAQVRAVSHRLHPPEWQSLTVEESLKALLDSSGFGNRMELAIDIETLPVQPAQSIKIALYRCAQECLGNMARHSGATRLALSLRSTGNGGEMNGVELKVSDNGKGFPQGVPKEMGIGLRSIREHASALGGTAHFASGLQGTTIQVNIPLSED